MDKRNNYCNHSLSKSCVNISQGRPIIPVSFVCSLFLFLDFPLWFQRTLQQACTQSITLSCDYCFVTFTSNLSHLLIILLDFDQGFNILVLKFHSTITTRNFPPWCHIIVQMFCYAIFFIIQFDHNYNKAWHSHLQNGRPIMVWLECSGMDHSRIVNNYCSQDS